MSGSLPIVAVVVGTLAGISTGRADWSATAGYAALAEVRVAANRIHLNLRARADAMPRLRQLAGAALADASLRQIAGSLVILRGSAGQILRGRSVDSHPAELPDAKEPEGFPKAPFVEAELEFTSPQPLKHLTLSPPEQSGNRDLALVVLDRSVPVGDPGTFNRPVRLLVDAGNPWKSRLDDPAFVRRHTEPRSYIYVEPFEVRHEMLLRLLDVSGLVNLGLRDRRFIELDERAAVLERITALLHRHNPLRIDDQLAVAQSDRAEFVAYGRNGILPVEAGERLETNSAVVGVVFSYLTDRPAHRLGMTWDLFTADRDSRTVSVVLGAESFDMDASRRNPAVEWSRDEAFAGEMPEASGADPVAGFIDAGNVRTVLAALLHNAYRAFVLRSEEAVYDRLAKSLDGDLLEDVYLQQRKAWLRNAEGLGGEGQVDRVEIRAARIHAVSSRPTTYEIAAEWVAHGNVSHWGHSHPRRNRYAARLSLGPASDGGWRIQRMDFEGGDRLDGAKRS